MKAQFVYESLNFERGGDPKKSLGIGLNPFIWDELYDLWEESDFKRLVNPEKRFAKTSLDSFFYVDEEDEMGSPEVFLKFGIMGVIDHPMSGYEGSYNQADVNLTVEKIADGKINVYGTSVMEIGKIRKGEDGDYDGDRYGGKKQKPKKIDFTIDSIDDLFDALEDIPQ